VLDRSLVDEWVKSEDGPSFRAARKLIRQEGLLCGGSSGSAMWAALQIAKQRGPGTRIVVVLPDSVRNYMTKFMDDRWMRENGFEDQSWETGSIGEVLRRMPPRELLTACGGESIREAVSRMKENGVSQMPVVEDGRVVGIVTESDVLSRLLEGTARLENTVAEVMGRKVLTVHAHEDASQLLDLFATNSVGIIVEGDNRLVGILTKMDLVDHLTHHLGVNA
jgi:cystathionine beta-synthase